MTSVPAPAPRKPGSRVRTVLLRLIPLAVVLLVLGGFIASTSVPMGTVTECIVTGHGVEPGGKGFDTLIVESTCGDFHTSMPKSAFTIGDQYSFELRGIHKPNIVDATRTG